MYARANGGTVVICFELLTTVEQTNRCKLIQMLLVIYGNYLGHGCYSNSRCVWRNRWVAVRQSCELSALWDSALATRDPR